MSSVNKKSFCDLFLSVVKTEKTSIAAASNVFTFIVQPQATKKMVKDACKEVFNVDAKSVNMLNIPGKKKRFRGKEGQTSDYKKAVITLPEGQSFDVIKMTAN